MFQPLLLVFPIALVVAAIWSSFSRRHGAEGWRRSVIFLSNALIIVGACGFFGQFVAGGRNWLPGSFEWPAGKVDDVLSTTNGYHIVLVPGVARIQVYDDSWHFLRGWAVPGLLRLDLLSDGTLEALAKGEKAFVFDTDGNLISQKTYGTREFVELENSLPKTGGAIVPTPKLLYAFSNPLLSWLVFATGFIGWFICSPGSKKA